MSAGICSYAACPEIATHEDMGWQFCERHLAAHNADMYGGSWAEVAEDVVIPECGTQRAAGRHRRLKEELCDACKRSEVERVKKYRQPKGRQAIVDSGPCPNPVVARGLCRSHYMKQHRESKKVAA